MEWFRNSYKITMELEDHDGKRRIETHRNMSLSDYEELYGTITDHILSIEMRVESAIHPDKRK